MEVRRPSPRDIITSWLSVGEEECLRILVSGSESCWRIVGNEGRLDEVECLNKEIGVKAMMK
jgi:hypothetical protein